MRQFAITLIIGLLTFGHAIGGENPKLFKEINRKIKVDFSKLDLKKENYVLVQFRVVDQDVQIIDADSSKEELLEVILEELNDMEIKATTNSEEIYTYKFVIEKER